MIGFCFRHRQLLALSKNKAIWSTTRAVLIAAPPRETQGNKSSLTGCNNPVPTATNAGRLTLMRQRYCEALPAAAHIPSFQSKRFMHERGS